MKKKLLFTIIILLVSIIVISCTSNKNGVETTDWIDADINCIKPVVELAYPTGFSDPILEEKKRVLPPLPWEPVLKIFEDAEDSSAGVLSIALRRRDEFSDKIWLSYYISEQKFVAYYDLISKKMVTYSSSDLLFQPRFIYASNNGGIWGVVYDEETPQKIFFVWFNDSTGSFEPVSEQINYLYGDIGAITEDNNNLYWISLMKRDYQTGENIYTFFSYDVMTSEIIESPATTKKNHIVGLFRLNGTFIPALGDLKPF